MKATFIADKIAIEQVLQVNSELNNVTIILTMKSL